MSSGPRKDGIFQPNLFLQFFLTGQAIGRLVESAIASTGITASDYAVLSAVDELEPVMPSEISRLTGMPRPTLASSINRLASLGLVARTRNPRDGRSYTLTLTQEGRNIKDQSGRALLVATEALHSELHDDAAELTAALARLRASAESVLA